MSDPDRKARAQVRRDTAHLRKTRLGAPEAIERPRGAAGISLVARLTEESWSLGGRPLPAYDRAETPYRFVRTRIP